jgi:hypothetical protein
MNPTLLDIVKVNAGIGFDLIEENVLLSPELRVIPADVITGTEMKLTVRTDLPTVGFRNLNTGTARSKSKYEERVFSCADLSGQIAVDMSLAKRALNQAQYLSNEASGFIEAAFRHVGKQTWYGTSNDAKGFHVVSKCDNQRRKPGSNAKLFIKFAKRLRRVVFKNGHRLR